MDVFAQTIKKIKISPSLRGVVGGLGLGNITRLYGGCIF